MPPFDLSRLLNLGYWFEVYSGPATPYTFLLLGLFATALVASLFIWLRRRQLFPGERIKTRLAARFGPWAASLSAVGAGSTLLRVAGVPLLSARFIWLACLLGLLSIVGYLGWYAVRRYPLELARVRREEQVRQFLPRSTRRRTSRRRRR